MMTKLTLKKLNNKYDVCSSIRETIDYANIFNLEYPERLSKPFLAKNPNSDEALEYALKLKQYEDDKAKYDSRYKEYNTIKNMNNDIIVEFICEAAGLNKIPEQYRDKVYSKAYQDGHANGYESVYNELCSLVEIFE